MVHSRGVVSVYTHRVSEINMARRVHHIVENGVLSLSWLRVDIHTCPKLCMADAGMDSYAAVSPERWPELYCADGEILEMRYHGINGIVAGVVVGITGVTGCLWFGTHAPSRLPISVRSECRKAEHSPCTRSPTVWREHIECMHVYTMLSET
jgi:hypothetical protein